MRSFEQSVTDPENQPSQYGTVLQREWQGLTDGEIDEIWLQSLNDDIRDPIKVAQEKLKDKNSG